MRKGPKPKLLWDRFWPRVRVGKPFSCWPYVRGHIDKKGYGRLRVNDPKRCAVVAHRIAWTLLYGPIPVGKWVLHRCDNARCCNPVHLFLGDHKDNMIDAMKKGRFAGRNANLKYRQVLEIKKLWSEQKLSQPQIAKLFNTTQSNVSAIVCGKSWLRVPKGKS